MAGGFLRNYRLITMPLEPQKKSEEMLRAWILKRRDAAGPRFEPHPATRRLLLTDVRRFHGQAPNAADAPGSFRDFWSLLYPRLAVSLATVAVAGLAIWLIAPPLARNPAFTFASRLDPSASTTRARPALVSVPPATVADAQIESGKKKEAAVFESPARNPSPPESQTMVGGRLLAAKSVADNKDVPLEKKVLKPGGSAVPMEGVETRFAAGIAPDPATTSAAYVPAAPASPPGTSSPVATADQANLALNGSMAREANPKEGSLAYAYGLDALADKTRASITSTGRLFKPSSVALRSELAATGAPSPQSRLKLPDPTNAPAETPARGAGGAAPQNIAIANGSVRPIALTVQRFAQISPFEKGFRGQILQNTTANRSLAGNAKVPNVANTVNAANNQANQASQGVLQSFDLEQNGNRISMVDGDGSVYSGEWISGDLDMGRANGQMNQAVDTLANNDRRRAVGNTGGVGGAGTTPQAAPPRLQVYFHADGISRTTKQPVVVRGFFELATTAPVLQNTQAAGAQALNITRVQAQIATGDNTPAKMDAVPVKP